MKTKQQLIEKILKRFQDLCDERLAIILQEELPDFTPYRIDEERMIELCNKAKVGYYSSWFGDLIKEYNSTIPEPLKPLPKEMPEWFNVGHRLWQLWQTLIDQYGTPPSKPSLPSVEELEKEMSKLWGKDIEMIQKGVATYLHNKYSLHPPQQEWWMKLKKGDRFMYYGQVREFSGKYITYLIEKNNVSYHKTTDCTPYTESELERGLKQADEATKNLIKLACEEAIKTGKIPTI